MQQAAEFLVKEAVIAIAFNSGGANPFIAQHGGQGSGNEPAEEQRDTHYRKEAIGKFRGSGFGKGDGHKAKAGDDGAGEQGPATGGKGVGGGCFTLHALAHFYFHKLHYDNSIVYQHAEGNNQSAQRYLVQINAHGKHCGKGAEQNQGDAAGNNVAAAAAQAK